MSIAVIARLGDTILERPLPSATALTIVNGQTNIRGQITRCIAEVTPDSSETAWIRYLPAGSGERPLILALFKLRPSTLANLRQ